MGFEEIYKYTQRFEGGYANNPKDRGGETFRGISRKNWPGWPGWALIDQAKAQGARSAKLINAAFAGDEGMAELVADFYRMNFWQPFEKLQASNRVHGKIFDTAVNVGVGAAVKMMQKAVNKMGPIKKLEVDGKIGPRTIEALDFALEPNGAESRFLGLFCLQQEAHYRAIVARDSSQEEFMNGWLRRAAWLPE
ncbi:MAG: hypothetical protein LBP33_06200 [Candidatus Adiutrix sp.]|jgi:lysozyme family protein|nr:hypothetical protein [Candidatus Adiutrix sp.]